MGDRKPMNEPKLSVVAALAATSNLGLTLPDARAVERRIRPHVSVLVCMADFAGQFVETDEHEDIFNDEAERWHKALRKVSDAELARRHPEIAALYDAALALRA